MCLFSNLCVDNVMAFSGSIPTGGDEATWSSFLTGVDSLVKEASFTGYTLSRMFRTQGECRDMLCFKQEID